VQLVNDDTPAPAPRRRLRWLRRGAIDLGDVVVQIFAVVIGILLALFIDNRVTERQQQNTVEEATRAIHAELAANRAALRDNAGRLHRMATHLESATENRNQAPRPCYEWPQWEGTGAVNLVDAAYQTAIATQAMSHMPFERAQRIAQAYGYQHFYQQAFSAFRTQFLKPATASQCAAELENFGRNERLLDSAYTPLIGPDKAIWPGTEPMQATPTNPSQ
jgi:type II secretory pathway pseudopilin PulG